MLPFYLSLLDDGQSESRFADLYVRHRRTMLRIAISVLHDQHLAEDAVHDAFMRILKQHKVLLERLYTLECHKQRAFIVITVRNIAIDQLRIRGRQAEVPLPDYGEVLRSEIETPEQAVIALEDSADLKAALDRLDRTCRDALLLQVVVGLSGREIAAALGISETAVRSRLRRGKMHLRKAMGGERHAEGSRKGYVPGTGSG